MSTLGESELIDGVLISSDLFSVLKISPMIGREFEEAEYHPGGPKSVIISRDFWLTRFSGQNEILGKSLTVDGDLFVIIGIMPKGFQFPWSAEIWIPWTRLDQMNSVYERRLHTIGRLHSNITLRIAESDLSAIVSHTLASTGNSSLRRRARVKPLDVTIVGARLKTTVSLLLLAAALVLLVVCLNISSIQAADSVTRRHETATSLALGATRSEVVWRCLTESVVISVAGGILGIVGSFWSIRYITATLQSQIPFWMEIDVDVPALVFTLILSILVGMVSGLQPAIESFRTPLQALQESREGSPRSDLWIRFLVVGQGSCAFILLISSIAAINGLRSIENDGIGLSLVGTSTFAVRLSSERYSSYEFLSQEIGQLQDRIDSISSIENSSVIYPMPLKDSILTMSLRPPSRESGSPDGEVIWVDSYVCTPEYFSILEIPFLAGNTFRKIGNSIDRSDIVVNSTLAQLYWGDDPLEAIGKSIHDGNGESIYTVVGVIADFRHFPVISEPRRAMFRPMSIAPTKRLSIIVASDLSASVVHKGIRNAISQFDNTLGVSETISISSLFDESMSKTRATTYALTVFAGFALVVALMGTYGLASLSLAWRARELAVRRALGASEFQVILLIVRQTLRLAMIGCLSGAFLSFPIIRLLRSAIQGVPEFPFSTLPLVWMGILFSSMLATVIPCIKSLRVSPAEALRD